MSSRNNIRSVSDLYSTADDFYAALAGLSYGKVFTRYERENENFSAPMQVFFQKDKSAHKAAPSDKAKTQKHKSKNDDVLTAPTLVVKSSSLLNMTDGVSQYNIQSSTDGYCVFNALASFLSVSKAGNLLDVLSSTLDGISKVEGGFSARLLTQTLNEYNIPVFTSAMFYQQFKAQSLKSMTGKVGYQISPCLIVQGKHVYIGYNPRATEKQLRPIHDFEKFVQSIVASCNKQSTRFTDHQDDNVPQLFQIPNTILIKKDSVRKQCKMAQNFTELLETHKPETQINANFSLVQKRKLKTCKDPFCKCASDIAFWALAYRLDAHVECPKIRCKTGALFFSSVFKKRFPRLFQEEDPTLATQYYPLFELQFGSRQDTKIVTGEYAPKMVDLQSVLAHTEACIVALHTATPLLDLSTSKTKTTRPHFDVKTGNKISVAAEQRGQAWSRDMLNFCSAYNIPFNLETNLKRAPNGSAHSFCRGIQDHCQALQLTQCLQQKSKFKLIVDVGAKFTSMMGTLSKALSAPTFEQICYKLPDVPKAPVAAAGQVQLAAPQDPFAQLRTFREDLDYVYMTMTSKVQSFNIGDDNVSRLPTADLIGNDLDCTEHDLHRLFEDMEINEGIHDLFPYEWAEFNKVRVFLEAYCAEFVVYIGIRPNVTKYDRLYWMQGSQDVLTPRFFGTTFQGTLEDFIGVPADGDLLDIHREGDLNRILEKMATYNHRLVAAFQKATRPDRFPVPLQPAVVPGQIRQPVVLPLQLAYCDRLLADITQKFQSCFDPRTSRWSTFFFDSHYYFTPEELAREHWFKRSMHIAYVTGGNFFPLAGHYMLPNNEGSYVAERGRIMMNTRGGDEHYEHAHNNYDQATYSFHSGWYTWFSDNTPYDILHTRIRMVETPRGGRQTSIQQEFLRRYLARVGATTTATIAQRFTIPAPTQIQLMTSLGEFQSMTSLRHYLSLTTDRSKPMTVVVKFKKWWSMFYEPVVFEMNDWDRDGWDRLEGDRYFFWKMIPFAEELNLIPQSAEDPRERGFADAESYQFGSGPSIEKARPTARVDKVRATQPLVTGNTLPELILPIWAPSVTRQLMLGSTLMSQADSKDSATPSTQLQNWNQTASGLVHLQFGEEPNIITREDLNPISRPVDQCPIDGFGYEQLCWAAQAKQSRPVSLTPCKLPTRAPKTSLAREDYYMYKKPVEPTPQNP